MTRNEVLARMGLQVPETANIRVIVSSDVRNEADDPFAIAHHLLTPQFDLKGIIAAHFSRKYPGNTMEESYQELLKLLRAAQIEDVPALRGCTAPLTNASDAPESEGVDFLIQEALREDPKPLYVACQGALTDVAAALNRCPEIASRMTVVCIAGGPYPTGRKEFNVLQDVTAAQVVFDSATAVWQIPQNAYSQVEVTFAELAARVRPMGTLGKYLFDEINDYNLETHHRGEDLRLGENWCLGDQPTVFVLMSTWRRRLFHTEKAPIFLPDSTYAPNPNGKEIRVYDEIDVRMLMEDFYCKLQLAYGK